MTPEDLQAIWLTLRLASITTAILLVIATPVAALRRQAGTAPGPGRVGADQGGGAGGVRA